MNLSKHRKSSLFATFRNTNILTKILILTTIIFILVSILTQLFLYNYVKDIIYNMELEKMKNAHATVYDTFTSASLTNQTVNSTLDEYNVITAKTYADILSNSGYSTDEINKVAEEINAEEIHITDEEGEVVYSTNPDALGVKLGDDAQSANALKVLEGETVVGSAPTRGDHLIQYINVPRMDQKGIVRIGFSTVPHKTIFEESSPQHSIAQTKIGETGIVMAINDTGNIRVHPDESLVGTDLDNDDLLKKVTENESGEIDFVENDIEYHGIYEKREGLYIIAAMGVAEIEEATLVVQKLSIAFAVINLLLIIFAVYLLFKNLISKRMKRLVDELEAVSSGDFTREISVDSMDEMGVLFTSFNHTVGKVRKLIEEVTNSVETVSSNSEELTASAHQITHVTQEVAKVINEIAISSTDQAEDVHNGLEIAMDLEKSTGSLSNLAKELHNISNQIERLKDQGIEVNEILTEKTIVSNQSVDEVFQMVDETDQSAKEINEIINVIDHIAEQTNLLALNASIEAARSGEHGRGFAVVAEEIGKLAVQSADSVHRVQSIIKELQNKSNNTVHTMTKVKELISEQTESVEDNKKLFSLLAEEISSSKKRVNKLASLEVQIVQDKSEIVHAFESLSNSASDNAASTEEVSASTHEQTSSIEDVAYSSNSLSELAVRLKNMMNQFNI